MTYRRMTPNDVFPTYHHDSIVFQDFSSDKKMLLEHYSGIVKTQQGFGDLPGPEHVRFSSFLLTESHAVYTYPPGTLIKTTVLVVPNSVSFNDDEATIAAVEDIGVELVPIDSAYTRGWLRLSFMASGMNSTINTVSYHVTVCHDPKEPMDDRTLLERLGGNREVDPDGL